MSDVPDGHYVGVVRPRRKHVSRVAGWMLLLASATALALFVYASIQPVRNGGVFPPQMLWYLIAVCVCIPIGTVYLGARLGFRNLGLAGMTIAGLLVAPFGQALALLLVLPLSVIAWPIQLIFGR